MRKSLVALTVAAAAASFATASGTTAYAHNGAPDPWLIGTWNCSVTIPASPGYPARTDHAPMTITEALDTTMHFHVGAADYISDSYDGYDKKTKTYWNVASDSTGISTFETSKDGSVFEGTSSQVGDKTTTRDTFTADASHTRIRDVSELLLHGTWTKVSDVVCTKH